MPESLFQQSCRPEACNFIKKETLAQVFSCDICEIFNNTFFTEHVRATASEICYAARCIYFTVPSGRKGALVFLRGQMYTSGSTFIKKIGVLMKSCSENMQQIYRRTPMLKCDLKKVVLQLH